VTRLLADPDHPALPGHFPAYPLLPAVVILELVVEALEAEQPQVRVAGVKKLKILRPLRPGEAFTVHWQPSRRGGLRFHCLVGDEPLAEGHLFLATE
jgi:3-hydroxymyristoyl/3-hydroxydecanoyl-(acyl carrier protein) dehydratase